MNTPSPNLEHTAAMLRYESEKKSPALAAIINFFFPGLGDAYAGRPIAGVSAFVVVLILGLLTWGIVYLLAAIVGIFTGIQAAQEYNRNLAQEISGEKPTSEFKYRKIEDMSDDEIHAYSQRRLRYNIVVIGGIGLFLLFILFLFVYVAIE